MIGGSHYRFANSGDDPRIGPSLAQFFSDPLANPKLELFQGNTCCNSMTIGRIRNKRDRSHYDSTGERPGIGIVTTLPANNNGYTAVVSGVSNGTGVAWWRFMISIPQRFGARHISTRGFVQRATTC